MNLTLSQAIAIRDALIATPPGAMGSVSIGGRTVSWVSLKEFRDHLAWAERLIAEKQRKAAGLSRHGMSLASFRSTQ